MFAFLAAHRAGVFPDADSADLFAPPGVGRPPLPATQMAAVLTLRALHDCSDRETAGAVRFDVRWKVAIGASLDDAGFDPSSLVYWRNRIARSKRPHRVNDAVKKVIEETGVLKGRRRRAADSTILANAVSILSRFSGVYHVVDGPSSRIVHSYLKRVPTTHPKRCHPRDLRKSPCRCCSLFRVGARAFRMDMSTIRGRRSQRCQPQLLKITVANQDTVTHLVPAIRRVAREVPGAAEQIAAVCAGHDYSGPGKPKTGWDDPAAKDALVSALVNDANAVVAALQGRDLDERGRFRAGAAGPGRRAGCRARRRA